jgi:GT2 family glycosyltransferase
MTNLQPNDQFLLFENDPEAASFKKPCSIKIIRNLECRSFAQNVNQAIDMALGSKSDLIFLNNDVVFTYGWLQPLLDINDAISLPLCNQQQQYDFQGLKLSFSMDWEDFAGRFDILGEIVRQNAKAHDENQTSSDLIMPFYCFRVPFHILQAVGRFDETFGSAGGEDIDYRFRTLLAGYDVVYANRSYLLHFQGKSTWRSGEKAAVTAARDAQYRVAFQRKWGERAATLFLAGGRSSRIAREREFSELIGRRRYRKLIELCLSIDKATTFANMCGAGFILTDENDGDMMRNSGDQP